MYDYIKLYILFNSIKESWLFKKIKHESILTNLN